MLWNLESRAFQIPSTNTHTHRSNCKRIEWWIFWNVPTFSNVNFRDYVLSLIFTSPFYSRERLHFNAKLNCKNLHINVKMFCSVVYCNEGWRPLLNDPMSFVRVTSMWLLLFFRFFRSESHPFHMIGSFEIERKIAINNTSSVLSYPSPYAHSRADKLIDSHFQSMYYGNSILMLNAFPFSSADCNQFNCIVLNLLNSTFYRPIDGQYLDFIE